MNQKTTGESKLKPNLQLPMWKKPIQRSGVVAEIISRTSSQNGSLGDSRAH